MKVTFTEKLFFLQNASQGKFFVMSIMPSEGIPLGIIQIMHGMAEHALRYRELGIYLANHGFGLVAADHPGHGQSAVNPEHLGLMPPNGWEVMLDNAHNLFFHIRTNYSDVPVFLFGHSMGSVLAQHFAAYYPVYLQGLILSGSFQVPTVNLLLMNAFVGLQSLIWGQDKKSKFFNRLFFSKFNLKFNQGTTGFEWISSNNDEVMSYVKDPFCGFDCSIGFYRNLGRGILEMKKNNQKLKYRKTLPLLIFSGDEDPVGNYGKDAIAIHEYFYKQHFQNLSVKIFHGRHELLHDTNKNKVFEFLLNWMLEHLHVK